MYSIRERKKIFTLKIFLYYQDEYFQIYVILIFKVYFKFSELLLIPLNKEHFNNYKRNHPRQGYYFKTMTVRKINKPLSFNLIVSLRFPYMG